MATLQECAVALQSLAERLAAVDPDVRARYVVDRTVACQVPDLDVVFLATLNSAGLDELRWRAGASNDHAQVRLSADSDDLIALVQGELSPTTAWATRRLKVQASAMDLLKLRALL